MITTEMQGAVESAGLGWEQRDPGESRGMSWFAKSGSPRLKNLMQGPVLQPVLLESGGARLCGSRHACRPLSFYGASVIIHSRVLVLLLGQQDGPRGRREPSKDSCIAWMDLVYGRVISYDTSYDTNK